MLTISRGKRQKSTPKDTKIGLKSGIFRKKWLKSLLQDQGLGQGQDQVQENCQKLLQGLGLIKVRLGYVKILEKCKSSTKNSRKSGVFRKIAKIPPSLSIRVRVKVRFRVKFPHRDQGTSKYSKSAKIQPKIGKFSKNG